MKNELVRLEQVSKTYGDVTALHPINLSVAEGEFFTLLGPSGSGKTTILNLVAGILAPSSGRIWISGRDITRVPSNARDLGMVFQSYALMPHMTVFDNVAYGLRVRRVGKAEIERRVVKALELVQLPNMEKRYPKELSGGQQQRIALARSLVYNPKIVLMDEPLSALDKKLRDQMQLQIKHLHSVLGVTVIYVTHDQGEALMLSDRICLMNKGCIEQIGTPHDLYFLPSSVFAADFLGESNLLQAVVAPSERGSVASLRVGNVVRLEGVLTPSANEGDTVTVMIRPECLSSAASPGAASLSAKVLETLLVGGVTEVRARLPTGEVVAMRELTSQSRQPREPGSDLTLYFKPEDVIALR